MNYAISGKVLVENVAENRAEWLDKRKDTVGSSEIVTVCGLNKYQSPLELWAQKTGKTPEVQENEFMRLGRHMEPFIGDLFARETGKMVRPANTLYGHIGLDWATASPDFFCQDGTNGDLEIVEAKNVSVYRHAEYEDGNLPNGPHMQVVWQLGVLGLKAGYVAALVGAAPNNFYKPRIEYSEELFSQMVELGSKFIANVRADIPPAARGSDKKLIESLLVRNPEKEIDLPESAGKLLNEYFEAEKMRVSATRTLEGYNMLREDAQAKLMQMMGDASIGHYGDAVVKVKKIVIAPFENKGSSYMKITIKQ